MQRSVIIVGGGLGRRMKSDIPKQFLELYAKPVIMHTIEVFYQFDNNINIIIVLPEKQIDYWQQLVKKFNFSIKNQIVIGGESRFHSVRNGLSLISEGIVGIHDAVRPLVSLNTIKSAFKMAEEKGNAIPVININESLRIIKDNDNHQIDRNIIKIVQTPQCFEASTIKKAYNQAYNSLFTDDASVLESTSVSINLSEGNIENIKITTAFDLIIAEKLLQMK